MMREYVFRVLRREPAGMLGPTLHEQIVTAADDKEAVAQAMSIDVDITALGANAVSLTVEDGRVIWSLHGPIVVKP